MSDETPTPPQPPADSFKAYFERASRERAEYERRNPRRPVMPEADKENRRIAYGFCVAFAASLLVSILSVWVNGIALRDLPVWYAPFGLIGNTLALLFIGVVIGMAAITPIQTQTRLMRFLLLAVVALFVTAVVRVSGSGLEIGFTVIFIAFLIVAFAGMVGYGYLVRWIVFAQIHNFDRPIWHWQRVLPAALLLAAILLIGRLFPYHTAEQDALHQVNEMIVQAQTARSEDEIPARLRGMHGAPFRYAEGDYSLSLPDHAGYVLNRNEQGRLAPTDIYVWARFQNSYTLYCQFTPKGSLVYCDSDWVPPLYGQNG